MEDEVMLKMARLFGDEEIEEVMWDERKED